MANEHKVAKAIYELNNLVDIMTAPSRMDTQERIEVLQQVGIDVAVRIVAMQKVDNDDR